MRKIPANLYLLDGATITESSASSSGSESMVLAAGSGMLKVDILRDAKHSIATADTIVAMRINLNDVMMITPLNSLCSTIIGLRYRYYGM
jgi:hypothetical protein